MAESLTPLMKQYWTIKAQYPEAVLLYRVGDFYETFGEDALKVSKALGIVLTRKSVGNNEYTQLAGFPYHALDNYLPKLIRAGYKAAVCDQLEDPKQSVKLVKRGVTELVTPGLAFNEQLLKAGENNFLCAVDFTPQGLGLAFLDISTGTFQVGQGETAYARSLLSRYRPKEILLQKDKVKAFKELFAEDYCISTLEEWAFVTSSALEKLRQHFGLRNFKGFGVEGLDAALTAAGATLYYLELTQHHRVGHICAIQRIDQDHSLWLDAFSIRNLELFPREAGADKGASLIEVIDRTSTPMGARLLRRWVVAPLTDPGAINARLNVVEGFFAREQTAEALGGILAQIGDLERLISKAAALRLSPREMAQLYRGLGQLPALGALAAELSLPDLDALWAEVDPCSELCAELGRCLTDEPPAQMGKGQVIRPGVIAELDRLRHLLHHGKEYLQQYTEQEIARTGIASLKVAFNNVFGYYIEVRNTHKDKVPADWIRKQTLVSAERYITPELKTYEEQILGAEENILRLEQEAYARLLGRVNEHVQEIQRNAWALARIDCLLSFARVARERNYVRPRLRTDGVLSIKQGRHPVIEALMPPGEVYVANDVYMDKTQQQIMILTGPNMSGKSALLRQTGLIVLLAQMGSFVPAAEAEIGIVDKLFTRVGASDNLSRGESTFMVEMLESSAILHNVSDNSLVLLDEIGRGTSTYDGLSIAWAMVAYLHEHPLAKPKTLFATHYHELNKLADHYARVKNFHIEVKEAGNKVLFLRHLREGGIGHSFGIHVARMAGMPKEVLAEADRLLKLLEAGGGEAAEAKGHGSKTSAYTQNEKEVPRAAEGGVSAVRGGRKRAKGQEGAVQLSLYQLEDPLLLELKDCIASLDLNNLSPLQAFDALRALKNKIGIENQ